jgi:hypothetical protein
MQRLNVSLAAPIADKLMRLVQFTCSGIVMVTCCNFIKQYEKTAGSYDRIRYTLVVAFIDMLCSSTRISIMTKENDKRWFLDLYPIIWWSVSFGLMVAVSSPSYSAF